MPFKLYSQEVLAPRPAEFSPPPPRIVNGLPAPSTNEFPSTSAPQPAPTEGMAQSPSGFQKLFNLGPVQLRPHLFYRVSYGDGIQAQPGHQSKTLVNEISPGIFLNIGSHWHLDYTPTLRYYSSKDFRDTLDHAASLHWGTAYQDWTMEASQSYVSSSTPLAETGSQTDQETYSTVFNAVYQLNSKFSLDASANQNFRFVGQSANSNELSDSKTWSTTEGFNYAVQPHFSIGLSAGFSYDYVSVGSDMMSEQLQARVNWHPGTKLTFSFSGGFEDRQFLDSNQSDSINPIFNLSSTYHIFDGTTFTLTGSRIVSPSYFHNQVTEEVGFTAGVSQRLLEKLYLDVSGGFGTTSYHATAATLSVNREDDHANINVRLSCPFLTRGTAAVFYDWTDHTSNQNGFEYTSNQVGLELGYRF